jgi:hypothetical protein
MSLKAFHILFITMACALALGLGVWCLQFSRSHGDTAYLTAAVASFAAAGALGAYGAWFWRKLRRWEDDVAKSKTSALRGPGVGGSGPAPRAAPHSGV